MSQLLQEGRDAIAGYRILRIGLSPQRAALYERINARVRPHVRRGTGPRNPRLLDRYGRMCSPWARSDIAQAVSHLRGECGAG